MNSGRNQVIAALAEAIFPALHDDASFARFQGDEKLANFLETSGRSLEIFTAEARPLVSLERSPKAIAKPDQRGASAVPGHLSPFQNDARTYHSIVNSHQNFSNFSDCSTHPLIPRISYTQVSNGIALLTPESQTDLAL